MGGGFRNKSGSHVEAAVVVVMVGGAVAELAEPRGSAGAALAHAQIAKAHAAHRACIAHLPLCGDNAFPNSDIIDVIMMQYVLIITKLTYDICLNTY